VTLPVAIAKPTAEFAPAPLELLVIQPTSLCNLDCAYCYVPDRQNASLLPIALLERLLQAVSRSRLAARDGELKILWHAGEPLAAGLDFYRAAVDATDRLMVGRRITHAIQTNGTLITDEWCEFFRSNGVLIGVSIDGPAAIHDANRVTRGGRGSFAQAMRGIERLRAHGIGISVLSVLTAQSIGRPDELFDFYANADLHSVAFNVEEIEGPNVRSSLVEDSGDMTSARSSYRAFMTRFAELNRRRGWPLTVREFVSLGQLIEARRATPTSEPRIAEQRIGAIVTMTRDGTLFSWSPELASGIPGQPNRFALGNINDVDTIDALFTTDRARAIQGEIDLGVDMCRRSCEYFGVCGGGWPGNKFYEHGTAATTETLKCVLQTQELAEVILSAVADVPGAVRSTSTVAAQN
jgi:uncharacterized protein